jgi:hypothetical protein
MLSHFFDLSGGYVREKIAQRDPYFLAPISREDIKIRNFSFGRLSETKSLKNYAGLNMANLVKLGRFLRLGGSFHHRCAIFSDPETKHFVGN